MPLLRERQLAVLALVDRWEGHSGRPEGNLGSIPVQVALFNDGSVVWRIKNDDSFEYRIAMVDPASIANAIAKLDRDWQTVPPDDRWYRPVDSHFRSFVLRGSGGAIELQSQHEDELDPKHPDVIWTEWGTDLRHGRSDAEIESSWKPEYLAFRQAWALGVAALKSLQPAAGQPLEASAITLHWTHADRAKWKPN